MYFEQHRCTLHGTLNRSAFEEAWQSLVQRHAALRSLFVWKRREPLQLVQKQVTVPWTYEDWRGEIAQNPRDLETRFKNFLADDRARGFDLAAAPLMRLALIRIADQEHRFVWSFHHAAIDGWSASTIFKELFALYDALSLGKVARLSAPRPYQEYMHWLKAQDLAAAESFWQQTLAGFTTTTPLNLGMAPTTDASQSSASQSSASQSSAPQPSAPQPYREQTIALSTETTAQLQVLARDYRVTTNTILLGAWALLLSRYSGEDDVLFGATVSGRPATLPGVEEMVGMFINTLPVRAQIDPTQSVGQWLQAIQAEQVEARQYEFSPLVQIQNWSDVPNDLPLFESIVLYENHPVDSVLWTGNAALRVSDVQVFEQTNYSLTLVSWPASEFPLQLRYDPSRFGDTAIAHVLEHLQVLLGNLASDAAQSIATVPMLTAAERQMVLIDWNATEVELPTVQSIPALFEAQVQRTPNAPALYASGRTITYTELNQLANRIAHSLISHGLISHGIIKGTHIAICIERSPLAVACLLAVLKTGAVYLPLDPAYPLERLNFILADAQAPLLLLQEGFALEFPAYAGTVLSVDADALLLDNGTTEGTVQSHLVSIRPNSASGYSTGGGAERFPSENSANLSVPISGEDDAYLIYTSGSTGHPKGVRGLHRGIANRCLWMQDAYPFVQNESCCQKTALSFVDSIYEILGPLLQGVPSVMIPGEVARDPVRLVRELAEQKVTRLILVPSLLRALLDTHAHLAQTLPDLKLWTSSGETLPAELAHRFCQQMPQAKLINLYGSSEVSADVTAYEVRGDEEGAIPIGRPIANTQLYLLDRHRNPVPLGVPGELYVGGASLSAGYWARPELTAARFCSLDDRNVDDPNHQLETKDVVAQPLGERKLFRTGDIARYRTDGTIEYLGRLDSQVKIRGVRVELGEIENALAALATVRESAVIVRNDSADKEPDLVAYVVSISEAELQPAQLQDHLSTCLPEQMIPHMYVMLESLPLLPNGKVDRQALPQPDWATNIGAEEYIAPDGPVEEMLADVWCEVLNIAQVGTHDNFFRLGGHSLLATQVASQLLQEFELDVPLQLLFDAPTIAALAPFVEEILMKEMA